MSAASWFRRILSVLSTIAALATTSAACAQAPTSPAKRDVVTALGGNLVIGALTAGTRAALRRESVMRAMAGGALGGIVHAAGKALNTERSSALATGAILSSVGTSMVANAALSQPLWRELSIPVGSLRVRVRGRPASVGRRMRVSVNAYESLSVLLLAHNHDLSFDLKRSLLSGQLVFVELSRQLNVPEQGAADGLTVGSVILVSKYAQNRDATFRHELVHAQQQRFMQELWRRPVEVAARQALKVRWLPEWLELGLVSPAISATERALTGGGTGPLRRAQEWESRLWERRQGPDNR